MRLGPQFHLFRPSSIVRGDSQKRKDEKFCEFLESVDKFETNLRGQYILDTQKVHNFAEIAEWDGLIESLAFNLNIYIGFICNVNQRASHNILRLPDLISPLNLCSRIPAKILKIRIYQEAGVELLFKLRKTVGI